MADMSQPQESDDLVAIPLDDAVIVFNLALLTEDRSPQEEAALDRFEAVIGRGIKDLGLAP